jgi:hypothetical protein
MAQVGNCYKREEESRSDVFFADGMGPRVYCCTYKNTKKREELLKDVAREE